MAQRASHYQSLHTELLDKVSHATDTEKEVTSLLPSSSDNYWFFFLTAFYSPISVSPQLKRKGARVAALEKQLQEKTSAYSQAALKNTELENQLLVQHTHTYIHICAKWIRLLIWAMSDVCIFWMYSLLASFSLQECKFVYTVYMVSCSFTYLFWYRRRPALFNITSHWWPKGKETINSLWTGARDHSLNNARSNSTE